MITKGNLILQANEQRLDVLDGSSFKSVPGDSSQTWNLVLYSLSPFAGNNDNQPDEELLIDSDTALERSSVRRGTNPKYLNASGQENADLVASTDGFPQFERHRTTEVEVTGGSRIILNVYNRGTACQYHYAVVMQRIA